jgi:hypothetical protein
MPSPAVASRLWPEHPHVQPRCLGADSVHPNYDDENGSFFYHLLLLAQGITGGAASTDVAAVSILFAVDRSRPTLSAVVTVSISGSDLEETACRDGDHCHCNMPRIQATTRPGTAELDDKA